MRKIGILHIVRVNIVYIFDIVANNTYVRRECNFVSSNNETSIVDLNKVHNNVWFKSLKSMVKISNMITRQDYEFSWIITAYGDNDLLGTTIQDSGIKREAMLLWSFSLLYLPADSYYIILSSICIHLLICFFIF